MLTYCNTLRCSTARACRSYIARARDRFSGGHGPFHGALGRPAERPGKSLAGVAAKKFKSGTCIFARMSSILYILLCPFAQPIRLFPWTFPRMGVRCVSPYRTINSLSYGAERNFFSTIKIHVL